MSGGRTLIGASLVKVFVTGLTGFVGPHLARMLLRKGCQVVGIGRPADNLLPGKGLPDSVTVVNLDIRDSKGLRQVLEEFLPDQVYHLAALSNVGTSFKDPRLTYDINVGGTLNLLEALRELDLRPRIVNISTGHVYRSIESEAGLREDSPLHLLTPYAASKYMSEALSSQYVEAYGFQVMTVRPFNHVGPGQRTEFVCSDFARQIAAIKLGQAEPVLNVGNLSAVRDFTDVRDTVEAYWIVASLGTPGEVYNVCSNCHFSIEEVVSMLCRIADVRVSIKVDSEKFRTVETARLFGNPSKVLALGWEPRIGFDQTLRDILDSWLTVLA